MYLQRLGRQVYRIALVTTSMVTVALAAGCSNGSSPIAPSPTTAVGDEATEQTQTRATGKRVKALDFAVRASTADQPVPSTLPEIGQANSESELLVASSPALAVETLLDAAVTGDFDRAWSQVGRADQERVGNVQRMREGLNAVGWTKFTIDDTTLDSVTATVTQTPKIDEIGGVVSQVAVVRVKTIAEDGGFKVLWSRRVVEQRFPEFSEAENALVLQTVTDWVAAKQACNPQPTNQYASGLVGVVGLADALCKTVGIPTVSAVQDVYGLDEPEPVLQAFGGSAASWVRVVSISAPVSMNVVLAPKGNIWIVVALARPSITQS